MKLIHGHSPYDTPLIGLLESVSLDMGTRKLCGSRYAMSLLDSEDMDDI